MKELQPEEMEGVTGGLSWRDEAIDYINNHW